MSYINAISTVRDAVCAVLRVHPLPNNQFNVSIVGTAWCVVDNKYVVTANHIFNNGQHRDPSDRFFVFSVPKNGPVALHVPIVSFVLEDSTYDMAIMEIDTSSNPSFSLRRVSVTFRAHYDGERVLTIGFPAPQIVQAQIAPDLTWRGGELLLKSHANEGIISGQFEIQGQLIYELNVGWYQGESGGPIFSLNPLAAFSIMQRYRNVVTPHGTIPGPHQGGSLALIEGPLRQIGTTVL